MADNITLDSMGGGEDVATDYIGSTHHQRVKVQHGADGSATDVSTASPLPVQEQVIDGRYKTYIDTSFVTGDSPVTLDVNTDLGRDGRELRVLNDGAGNFTVAVSNDGITYSDEWTMKTGETLSLSDVRIDSVRITWVADSSYRVLVI